MGGNILLTGQLIQSMPADYWSSGNTFIELNGVGNLTHMGAYETCLTSNGYRDTNAQWVSYAVNSATGASQIRLNPAGYIAFATESNKSTGSTHTVTERVRITSSGSVRIGGTTNSSFSAHTAADDLVIGATSGSNGMTILTGSATGNIFFNDGSGNDGVVQYVHSSSPNYMRIASSGHIRFDVPDGISISD